MLKIISMIGSRTKSRKIGIKLIFADEEDQMLILELERDDF